MIWYWMLGWAVVNFLCIFIVIYLDVNRIVTRRTVDRLFNLIMFSMALIGGTVIYEEICLIMESQ